MTSPGFSTFRDLMDTWDEQLRLNRLQEMEEGEEMSFFFKKGGDVFGAPEDSRLTFARLKNPDEDADKHWALDATFTGYNLKHVAEGERAMRLFTKKDLSEIKVMSKEDAMKEIKK